MRFLGLLAIILALTGFLAGCAAEPETPSVEEAQEDTGVQEVAVEEPPETTSETTAPATDSGATQSEQTMNASPEEKEAARKQEQARAAQGISVTQTAAPNPATVGQPLTFTVTVMNYSVPQRFGFKDFLPPSMTLVSVTPSQGTCGTSHHGGNELECTLGMVSNEGSAMVEVVVTPTVPGTMTNTAVGLAEFTPATPANTDVATITVEPTPEPGTSEDHGAH